MPLLLPARPCKLDWLRCPLPSCKLECLVALAGSFCLDLGPPWGGSGVAFRSIWQSKSCSDKKRRPSRNTAPVQRNRGLSSQKRIKNQSEIVPGASCDTLCEKVARKSSPEVSRGRLGIDLGGFGTFRERLGRPQWSSQAPLDTSRERSRSPRIAPGAPGRPPDRFWVDCWSVPGQF